MKKAILAVAVAGLSVLAVAQSEKEKKEVKPSTPVVTPRDSSTGMASGKQANWDIKKAEGSVQDDSNASNAREVQTGMASGKVQKVSADAATQTADHSVSAPRDAATGQASGKRQHSPVTMTTTEEANKPAEPKKK
jgi:hypothetical protein